MRLISLNAWCGRALHPLITFLKKAAPTTDIFCLQEILHTEAAITEARHPDEYVCADLFPRIVKVLPDFQGHFAAFEDNPARMSLATFVRRSVSVKSIGDFVVYRPEQPVEHGSAVISSRKLQHLTVDLGGRDCVIANCHGIWTPDGKCDNPERLQQSRIITEWLAKFAGPKVLCGDFNLDCDTESLAILERQMTNLIKSHGITSTRTPLYREYDKPDYTKYADYAFVSPDVKVEKFEVLPDLASDHAALRLEFS